MKFNEFIKTNFQFGLISLQNFNIWINIEFLFVGGILTLELLKLVLLLILLGTVIKLVNLTTVELPVQVIRIDKALQTVVIFIIFTTIGLCPASSTASAARIGQFSPLTCKRILKDEDQNDDASKDEEEYNMNLSQSAGVKVLRIVSKPW